MGESHLQLHRPRAEGQVLDPSPGPSLRDRLAEPTAVRADARLMLGPDGEAKEVGGGVLFVVDDFEAREVQHAGPDRQSLVTVRGPLATRFI